ncbi:MAG: transcription antitermination factor NusB [Planctomycetota bacterium]
MATPRDVRRFALQLMYQLDAAGEQPGSDRESELLAVAEPPEGFEAKDRKRAEQLATDAFAARSEADAEFLTLAPEWPASRQAAVDRAILRLAHHEMVSGKTEPKIVVNEAVELAKVFSTEKSPAFVNGLLDRVLKRVLAERGDAGAPTRAAVD